MSRKTSLANVLAACCFALAPIAAAHAADHPIAEARLSLRTDGGGARMTFVGSDDALLAPTAGGADDPTSAGATLEVFSITDSTAVHPVPASGWTSKVASRTTFRFSNSDAPSGPSVARKAILVSGKSLKVLARSVAITMNTPMRAIAVRLTMGSTRYCAVFGGDAVTTDVAGKFSAKSTTAPADCSDQALRDVSCSGGLYPSCGGDCLGGGLCQNADGGAEACHCVAASQLCGGTSPTCNGPCPSGQECVSMPSTVGGVPECNCIAAGADPCGTQGTPSCGGACPTGEECAPIYQTAGSGGALVCTCGPAETCGQLGGLACGGGFACSYDDETPSCAPMSCDAAFETCGGPCGDGGSCYPFFSGSYQACICSGPLDGTCDSCGGVVCGPGQACGVHPGIACGCTGP
ncbi:MAG TPA: hypothetical protein VEL28_07230 [Candidatus Binatia bacterium]|nr:hypothetical protein [Candidatus Binatia bacterium]